jgi:hypothetical protein
MKDGMIMVGSPRGKALGFTSDKFTRTSYLWKKGDTMFISLIESKESGKGYYRALLDKIEGICKQVIVPSPSNRMIEIMQKRGYTYAMVHDNDGGYEGMVREIKA